MKSIKDLNIANKVVFLRADFNLPMENGMVLDNEDFRIQSVVPTIEHLLEGGNKVVLVSHLGRPDGEWNKKYSLVHIQNRLEKTLKNKIEFLDGDIRDKRIWQSICACICENKDPGVFLLENIRFYPEEEKNDIDFAKQLASCADIFVNDAFAVSHRSHASVDAITKFLPSYAGLGLLREVEVLNKAIHKPEHPLTVIIGGLKAKTKVKVVGNFLPKADFLIFGGVLANSTLSSKGIAIGRSIINPDASDRIKKMKVSDIKIHIPMDVVVSSDMEGDSGIRTTSVEDVKEDEIILDIGPKTIDSFSEIIKKSKMIIWNGPLGKSDLEIFSKGTQSIARVISESGAYSVAGGGDTIAVLHRMNVLDKFSYVSTGGGAMLEYLAGNKLPGIEALK